MSSSSFPEPAIQERALRRCCALVEGDMANVNRIILDRRPLHVELIPELAGHLINSGGKRIRPMLTVAAASCAATRASPCQARDSRRIHAYGDAAA